MTPPKPAPIEANKELYDILKGYGIRSPKMIKQFAIKELTLTQAVAALLAWRNRAVVAKLNELIEVKPDGTKTYDGHPNTIERLISELTKEEGAL